MSLSCVVVVLIVHILLTTGPGSHPMERTYNDCPGGPPRDVTERVGKPLPGERCNLVGMNSRRQVRRCTRPRVCTHNRNRPRVWPGACSGSNNPQLNTRSEAWAKSSALERGSTEQGGGLVGGSGGKVWLRSKTFTTFMPKRTPTLHLTRGLSGSIFSHSFWQRAAWQLAFWRKRAYAPCANLPGVFWSSGLTVFSSANHDLSSYLTAAQ